MIELNKIHHGDCLELMKEITAGSVDLIITDPPYGNMEGTDLDGWEGNKTDWDVALNPKDIFKECERVLRENGILILFSQEPYTSKLITESHGNLPFLYRMIWEKDHFANSLFCKKAPVSYFEDILVFAKKYDTLNLNPLRNYARSLFVFINKKKNEIFIDMDNQSVCHFMRTESMQFDICTKKTYDDLIHLYRIDMWDGYVSYNCMKDMNIKAKEGFKKIFNLPKDKKIKSNILKYRKDYGGLHPTQKPVELIKDIVKTYSKENDLVLDFTCGSGTTNIACEETSRFHIGIEKEQKYCEIANKRLDIFTGKKLPEYSLTKTASNKPNTHLREKQ